MKEILDIVDWLAQKSMQVDTESEREQGVRIVHGDYRIDNLVVQSQLNDVGGIRVKAVLDWELGTIGDPWCDVAYFCLQYRLPRSIGIPCLDSSQMPEEVLSEKDFVRVYCEKRGIHAPDDKRWAFYLCLSIFRMIGILVGVQARAMMGNASGAQASELASDATITLLVDTAHKIIIQSQTPTPTPTPTHTLYNSSEVALLPLSPKCREILHRLKLFMQEIIFPIEKEIEAHSLSSNRWSIHPKMEELKIEAKKQALWNLWVPADMSRKVEKLIRRCVSDEEEVKLLLGPRLNTTEYAVLAECMGSCLFASEVFNCSAPDTGNMEVLARFGSQQQQEEWLISLLRGDIRSCFAMTEKKVASSDATNIETKLTRISKGYIIDGLKWWISGAMDPRCELCILFARNNWQGTQDFKKHQQHTMVLLPMKLPGVRIVRAMEVFGYDDAPHGHAEIEITNVRIPEENVILGEGRGFEVAQGRLGPGRIHHCMRAIGMGERAMSLIITRSQQRVAFGQPLHRYNSKVIGNCRIDLDLARLLVMEVAATIDRQGAKLARLRIAEAKVRVPRLILGVIDAAIQMHGGEGVSQDTHLARLWAVCRTLRLADGPDDVHLDSIGKCEIKMSKL